MRKILASLAFSMIVAFATRARAQPQLTDPPQKPQVAATTAAGMFSAVGTSFYQTGNYDDAAANFKLAWDLSRDPALAYDIALCAWRQDRPYHAWYWLKMVYLRKVKNPAATGAQKLIDTVARAINEDDAAWHVTYSVAFFGPLEHY